MVQELDNRVEEVQRIARETRVVADEAREAAEDSLERLSRIEDRDRETRDLAEKALDKFPLRTKADQKERHIHDLGRHIGGVIGARVYNDAAISHATSGAWQSLTFNQERFDTDTIHSTSSNTGRLTATTAGKYIISGCLSWATNGTGTRIVRIFLNGTTPIERDSKGANSAATVDQTITTIYDLAADDYVELAGWQNSGGALDIKATSNFSPEFSMARIGAAGTSQGGSAGVSHGSLTLLNVDDHSQYLLAAGTRALTGDWAIGDNSLTGINGLEFTDSTTGGIGVSGDLIATGNLVDKSAAETVTGAWTLDGAVVINNAEADVDFRVAAVGATNALFVQGSNGKVGIGTAAPERILHIKDSVAAQRLLVDSTLSRATVNQAFLFQDASGKAYSFGNFHGNFFVFSDIDNKFISYQSASGDLGINIGAVAPSAQLHVDQDATDGAQPVLLLDQADLSEQCIKFSSDGADRDINLFTVDVDGVPTMLWDESDDDFNFNKGLDITGAVAISGTITGPSGTWDSGGMDIAASDSYAVAGTDILADSAGTMTLSNVDALDATTEATIEAAIDTLANLISIQSLTVTLSDAGADAILGWDDTASAYENLTQAEVLAVIGSASLTAQGVVELATGAETNTGTDATRAVTPDGLDDWTGSAQLVTTGALDSGSITSGFGTINIGSSSFTTTGTINGGPVIGTAGVFSAVGGSLFVQNTQDAGSVVVVNLHSGNRATPTDGDGGIMKFNNDNSTGAQDEFARLTWIATDVTNTSKDGKLLFAAHKDSVLTDMLSLTPLTTTLTADNIDLVGAAKVTGDLETSGTLNLSTSLELGISGGVVTATRSHHTIDTQDDDATDDLDTINGDTAGDILVIYPANSARTVVVKDGTGNLFLAGDFTMDNAEDAMVLFSDGTNWRELSRSDNGA